ncbi:hypothetical protein ACFL9U_07935, partial [Thermodesulfobacteriota bacterium]
EKRKRPEPDFLVATGPENRRLLISVGRRDPGAVVPGSALRQIPEVENIRSGKRRSNQMLLALDGVKGAERVLNWMIANADSFRHMNIKIRSHPNIKLTSLLDQCVGKLPANFSISRDDLDADIRKSCCVLYRQTSVGLQAIMNGVPAIHLNVDAPLKCDPIAGLQEMKWTARTPEDILSALNKIDSFESEEIRSAAARAKEYAREYFCPPTEKNMAVFTEPIENQAEALPPIMESTICGADRN